MLASRIPCRLRPLASGAFAAAALVTWAIAPALATGPRVALSAWNGPPLTGSLPGTTKFAVHVAGRPGETVHVRTLAVPAGWITSFCTTRVCSPRKVALALGSGKATIELQYIRERAKASAPARAEVRVAGMEGTSEAQMRFVEGSH